TVNNSPTIVHAHGIKIHLVRPISGVACGNWSVDPPARIIANLRRPTLTACLTSDAAYHFSCKHWFFAPYFPVSGRVETCIRRYEQHESFSDVEEFQMKKILTQYAVCALAVALMVPLAQAQTSAPVTSFRDCSKGCPEMVVVKQGKFTMGAT